MSLVDNNGNGLADSVAPLELRIIYHPITHQLSCQLPKADDIVILGMLECAKAAFFDLKQQQRPITIPNLTLKPGQRLT